MADLTTVATCKYAFLRLVGTVADDDDLIARGEAVDDVIYLYLTRGCRRAQRYMLQQGWAGWRQRSTALSFSTDAITAEQYASVPTGFLRAYGDERVSALLQSDGTRWGTQITTHDGTTASGNYYYIDADKIRVAKNATLPSPCYLDYHAYHAEWTGALASIDFPLEARALIVAYAADEAKEDAWLPFGDDQRTAISRAVRSAERTAHDVARTTKQPKQWRRPRRAGNHY